MNLFPNITHGFEDLSKLGLFNKAKKHNGEVSK